MILSMEVLLLISLIGNGWGGGEEGGGEGGGEGEGRVMEVSSFPAEETVDCIAVTMDAEVEVEVEVEEDGEDIDNEKGLIVATL